MSLTGALGLFGSSCTGCSCYQPRHHPASVGWWCSHSSFCPTSTTEVTVKIEMRDSGCLLSRGLIDLRLSLIPDGYKQLPRAGHMNTALQCTSGGSFALAYVGAWVHKKHRVSAKKKICLLVWTFRSVFRETKICIHQSGTQKASHNPEYENMSRAACKMDLHTSELHIQHSAGHPKVH